MENPTYVALSRLIAQQRTMDVIANNMANANTPGFKAEHVLFSDWMLKSAHAPGSLGSGELDFTQDRATWRDQSPGTMSHSGNPLDLAIGSQGFFSLKTNDGVRLTRAGRFTLQSDGTISDSAGNALLDQAGAPLAVPAGDQQISVSGDGTISSEHGEIGKIGVVMPDDMNRLSSEGNHLFRSDSATHPSAAPKIVQGAVEDSNVSPMLELTGMMQLSREFQFMSQFIQSEADRQQNAIDKLAAIPSA